MTVSETQAQLGAAAIAREGFPKGQESAGEYRLRLSRAALTAALSDQAGGWQDISTAPKYDDVLVWVPFQHGGGKRQIARYDHEDGGWIDDNDDKMTDAYKPTAWQPLPAPSPRGGE